MANVVLSGDTSGAITIAAPAVAGTNTLTLPASTGTLLDNNSSLASANLTGALPAIDGSALTGLSVDVYDASTASTGFFALPTGTTAQRPGSPANGYTRYNTTTGFIEAYNTIAGWADTTKSGNTFHIEYLVIAGGGRGASVTGGGGGAGGYRSSYAAESSGGGGGTETPLSDTLSSGTVYTITVGAGSSSTANGSNSSITASGIDVTSLGGGSQVTKSGGSGVGVANNSTGGAGTSGQGFKGGNQSGWAGVYGCGGGGGAAAEGVIGTSSAPGNGGDGVQSSITGSATYRAGGGGGGTFSSALFGSGGLGGGGNGAGATSNNPGTVNTGGGGGGSSDNGASQGNGGSGVVIFRLPTAQYSGTTTGSPTITTSGSDTIIKFTSSGTYTV